MNGAANINVDQLRFDADGLLPAVVQDARTGEVLTLAYVNRASFARTLETGETWFWSRSRGELWHKGATSGNTQRVVEMRLDCDGDALVLLVEPRGPACHTGARSCFAGGGSGEEGSVAPPSNDALGAALDELYATIERRRDKLPKNSYTTYLFTQGIDKILKKIGEESAETIIAAKNGEATALAAETSDLLYHLMVMLVERRVPLGAITAELRGRQRGGSQK